MILRMAYSYPTHTQNPQGLYGPTSAKHSYKAVSYHNRKSLKRSTKSRWAITEGQQYEVFRIADEAKPDPWHCVTANGHFSVVDKCREVLGTNEERLGFFQKPANVADPWHGYPVHSSNKKPSPALLDAWIKVGAIGEHVRRKIERGAI